MKNCTLLVAALMVLVAGCDGEAPVSLTKVNAKNWAVVGIGQDKQVAIHLLGEPDAVNQVSVLGVETEQLVWKTHLPERHYTLDVVMGRVVAKQTQTP
jgi:hypothetical protein